MRKLESILIILLLATSMVLTVPARSQSAGYFTYVEAYWGITQSTEVSPGDVATLTVVLRFESSLSLKNLEANLTLPDGFEAVGGGINATATFAGGVTQGSQVKLQFLVLITPEVEKGSYTTDLELRYYVSGYLVTRDAFRIAFEITGKPSVDAKAFNSSLYEGKQRVLIAFTNDGDAIAKNLRVSRVYSSVATAELEDTKLIDSVQPGAEVTMPVSIFVPMGMEGKIIPLTVEYSYLGPLNVGYQSSRTLQIPVKLSATKPMLRLDLVSKELSIGKSNEVLVNVANDGGSSLTDVKISLTPDTTLKIFGSTDLYIDRLDSRQSKQIKTEIYVPSAIQASTASLTATATYFDEGLWASVNIDYRFSLLLRGLIELSLTDMAVIPSTPRSGNPFSITVTVTNIGTSTASGAYAVPLLEGLPVKPFGPKSVYIGNIEVNLPTTFTLNMRLENTTAKEITLPVVISYMDNLRLRQNVTFSMPIEIGIPTSSVPTAPQGGFEIFGIPVGIFVPVIAVVAVATVAVVVLKRRGRKE